MTEKPEVGTEPTEALPNLDKRAGCGGCLFKSTMLLVVLLLCLAGIWFAFQNYSQAKLAAQLDELRQARLPTSVSELQSSYVVPNGELNTTEDWENAISLLASSNIASQAGQHPLMQNESPLPPVPPSRWPNSQVSMALVDSMTNAIIELRLATTGHALLSTDFYQQKSLPAETISQLEQGFWLLRLDCFVQAHRGKTKSLVSSLMACLNYSRCLDLHPAHQRLRFEFDRQSLLLLASFLKRVEFSEPQLKALQSIVNNGDYWQGIRRYLNQERAIALHMYTKLREFKRSNLSEQMRTADEWRSFWKNIDINLVYSPFAAEDAEQFLAYIYEIESKASGNFVSSAAVVAELEESIRQQEPNRFDQIRYPTARFLVPTVAPLISSAAATDSLRQVVLAAIAADRYRVANGQPPTDLIQLTPEFLSELPTDAFTGNAISYTRRRNELVFYNLGPNKLDDKGGRDDESVIIFVQKWDPAGGGNLTVD